MDAPLTYNHYKVLGVERNASDAQIKRAYRQRVKHCHPDRDHSAGAHRRFLIVHEAYSTLSQPLLRKRFDERLSGIRAMATPDQHRRSHVRNSVDPNTVSNDQQVPRFAFLGLHITGLLFGIAMVLGVMIGYVFFEWPAYIMLLGIAGLVVIPDSIEGLRPKARK